MRTPRCSRRSSASLIAIRAQLSGDVAPFVRQQTPARLHSTRAIATRCVQGATREQLQRELLQIRTVFVNHSVEEAVLLADDVLVASADTRWIESEIVIDLPQPRDVSSPEFNAILRDVARRLSDHLASRAQTGGAPA